MSRYIEADKLKNELDKMCREYTQEKSTFHPHIDFVLEVIDAQPTADVRENVSGEWVESMHRVCGEREYKCSNCNKVIWSGAIDRYNFCPNCGADMRGEV